LGLGHKQVNPFKIVSNNPLTRLGKKNESTTLKDL
jgi:hypothetical protein